MKALIASVLLAAICSLTPAFAQDTPSANPPSQAQIDAAMEMIQATNATANLTAMLDLMQPLTLAQIKREHPGISEDTADKLTELVRQAIGSHEEGLLHIAAITYAQHFSIDELKGLTAFYRSDLGHKYVTEIPAILKQNAPVEIAYLRQAIQEEVAKAIEKLRAQGVKI